MTTNYANDTNYLAIRISEISEIRSHRKFQVQCSNLMQIGGLDPLPHEVGQWHRQERGRVIHAVHVGSRHVHGNGAPVRSPGGYRGRVPDVVGVSVRQKHRAHADALELEDLADQVLDSRRRIDDKGSARPGRDEHKPIRRVERRRNDVKTHVTPWRRRSARARHAWFRGSHARRKPPCCHP